jgi:hypothetical protein
MEMRVAASIDHPNICPYLPGRRGLFAGGRIRCLGGLERWVHLVPEHFGLGAAAPPPGRGASKEWIAVQLVAFCCSDG